MVHYSIKKIMAPTLRIRNMAPLPYIYRKWPAAKYMSNTCTHRPCPSHKAPLSNVLSHFVNADVRTSD